MIVLDTLRKYAFDEHFDWLLSQTKTYEHAYSTSHWTIPAFGSLLTGHYPSEHAAHSRSPNLPQECTSIATVLQDNEYTTRFYSDNAQFMVWDGWTSGFDDIKLSTDFREQSEGVDWKRFGSTHNGSTRYLRALRTCLTADNSLTAVKSGFRHATGRNKQAADGNTETIISTLENTTFDNTREFLLVNLMDAHTPYRPPSEFREGKKQRNVVIGEALAKDVNATELRTSYEEAVKYLSNAMKRLYNVLAEDFEYIIIVGDHGELHGMDGLWNHGYGLHPELVKVPLTIDTPTGDSGRIRVPVNHMDIHQTVADIAGVNVESRGRDLRQDDSLEPRALLTEYHGLLDWHRDQFEEYGISNLFDPLDTVLRGVVTASGGYAYETHPTPTSPTETIVRTEGVDQGEALQQRAEIVERLDEVSGTGSSSATVSEDVQSRLEELGYR